MFAMFAIFYACTTRTFDPPLFRVGSVFWCLVLFGVRMVILEWNIERLDHLYGASYFSAISRYKPYTTTTHHYTISFRKGPIGG